MNQGRATIDNRTRWWI